MKDNKTRPKESENDSFINDKKKMINENYDKKYTKISLYVIFTFLIIYILRDIIDNFAPIVTYLQNFLSWLTILLKPLFIGFAIAYLLYPIAGFFEKKLQNLSNKNKLKAVLQKNARGYAVLITFAIIVLIIFLLLTAIVSTVSSEIKIFTATDIDTLISAIAGSFESLSETIKSLLKSTNISSAEIETFTKDIGNMLTAFLQNTASNIFSSAQNITSFFSNLIFSIIFAIYFLLDGNGIMKYWDKVLYALFGKRIYDKTHIFLSDADSVFAGYIRGQCLDAAFMAVVVSIALALIGIKYSIIIGILTGIGNLIPYIGPFVAYASTILISILDGDYKKLIIAIIALFVIQTIDGNVVNPKLLSNNINIHPLLVVAALIIGGAIGGIIGMLMAVPCAGLIKLYFDKLIEYLSKSRSQNMNK